MERNKVTPSPALWAGRAVCPHNSCLPQGAVSDPTPMQRVADISDGQDPTAINSPTALERVVFGPGRRGICPTFAASLGIHMGLWEEQSRGSIQGSRARCPVRGGVRSLPQC